jgi:hypothetical protein
MVGYTILAHEGGVGLFKHRDGVMQTIESSRKDNIPRIPRELKLTLLGLPLTDATSDRTLTSRLQQEFHSRLAVQIATGIQELTENLQRFSCYVALAFVAYNAGPGRAAHVATQGRDNKRPRRVSAQQWEEMCRLGAALLHQPPIAVRVEGTQWRCDVNIPT